MDRYGLILNNDECVFAEKEFFWGHVNNSNGIKPLPNKVDAIKNFPQPRTVNQLRFLGLVNYYRRFLYSASQTLASLTDLLTKDKVRVKSLSWNNEAANAFETIKLQIADETMLSFPMGGAKNLLIIDSSGSSVGAVLSQVHEGLERPLPFFSKNFSNVQRTYSAFNRELLGAYLGVKHFKYLLEDREFSLITDHKPLVSAIGARMHDANAMQSRYLAYISEFTTDAQYFAGSENVVADCLSRPHAEVNAIYEESIDIDLSKMAIEQVSDSSVSNLLDGEHFLQIVKRYVMILGD